LPFDRKQYSIDLPGTNAILLYCWCGFLLSPTYYIVPCTVLAAGTSKPLGPSIKTKLMELFLMDFFPIWIKSISPLDSADPTYLSAVSLLLAGALWVLRSWVLISTLYIVNYLALSLKYDWGE